MGGFHEDVEPSFLNGREPERQKGLNRQALQERLAAFASNAPVGAFKARQFLGVLGELGG
jgi:hypothetical protein